MDQTQKEIKDFFSKFPDQTFSKQKILINSLENPKTIFYLVSGYVKQYAVSPEGKVIMLTIFKPGAFFPLTWALNNTTNTSYFESVTNIVVSKVPKQYVIQFLENHPEVLLEKTRGLLLGISGLLDRIQTLTLDSAPVRTARVLKYFGNAFGENNGSGVRIPFPLPHREIAAWVGLTRETVSIQIEKFKKKEIILYDGRLLKIIDMQKLLQEIT